MIGLLQRVTQAQVKVNGTVSGAIGPGVLVFIGVQHRDGAEQADRLLKRILQYRLFPDAKGRMNLSVADTHGGVLLVPQFTLAADTNTGNRPSFSTAALPEKAEHWFDYLVLQARLQHRNVQAGVFGADMQVALINDGPVTFWLEVPPQTV